MYCAFGTGERVQVLRLVATVLQLLPAALEQKDMYTSPLPQDPSVATSTELIPVPLWKHW